MRVRPFYTWALFVSSALVAMACRPTNQTDRDAATRAWSDVETIARAPGEEDRYPAVVMNAGGDGLLSWLRGGALWARPYDGAHQRWGTAVMVAPVARAASPRVGIDGQGNSVLLWARDDTEEDQGIWSSRGTNHGSDWSSPVRLRAGKALGPQLAVSAGGTALAAWTERSDGNVLTVASCDFRAGAWNPVVNIPRPGADSGDRNPRVAVDGGGGGFLIWEQPDSPNGVSSVWTERYDGSWVFSSVAALETFTGDDAYAPSLALNESGVGMAVWLQLGANGAAGGPQIWGRAYDSGAWKDAAVIGSSPLIEWDPPPDVAIDPAGSAVAIWSEVLPSNPEFYNVRAARHRTDARTWGAPRFLETTNLISSDLTEYASPRVGIDGAGDTLAVWRRVTAAAGVQVYTSRLSASATDWMPENGEALHHAATQSTLTLDLAVSRNGTALAAWYDGAAFELRTSIYR
ncbi:MAG: hypothetical protein ABUS79_15755 [Pseudomonadota bacterium]